jgi:archaemetzincin
VNPESHQSALLDLIPLGHIDPLAASVIAAHLQAVLGLLTDIRPSRPLPEDAFMSMRNQYDASKIIRSLAADSAGAPFKMGVTARDISIPILTYVFGESQLGGRIAVISIHRLHHVDRQLVFQRAAKIAIHEAGHLLGLEHCFEVDCLMRFSKQTDQLDHLPMHFCSSCQYEADRRMKKVLNNQRH